MDLVQLALAFELVTRRHPDRCTTDWVIRPFDNENPSQDCGVGCHLLFHDWTGNHSRYLPFLHLSQKLTEIRISSIMGSPIVYRFSSSAIYSCCRWWWCSRRFHPMVVSRSSCSPSIHGHRKRSILSPKGINVCSSRMDDTQTKSQTHWTN